MEINPFKIIKKYDIKKSVKEHNKDILADLTSRLKLSYRGRDYLLEIDKLDDINITFIIPPDLIYVIGLNKKDIVKASIFSENGLYNTNIRILEKRLVGDCFYCDAELNARIDKIQRRKHIRVPVNLSVNCNLIGSEVFESTAKDISIGGMLLNCKKSSVPENFYDNQDIEIVFDLEDYLFRLKGLIIRAKENISRDTYVYHVKFTNITEEEKNIISKFVTRKREYLDNRKNFSSRRK